MWSAFEDALHELFILPSFPTNILRDVFLPFPVLRVAGRDGGGVSMPLGACMCLSGHLLAFPLRLSFGV